MSEAALTFSELESAAAPLETTAPVVTTEDKPVETPTEAKPQFTEQDVAAYQQLVELGITPINAKDFIAAKQGLDALPALMKNNPDLLMDEIQKYDPQAHDEFMERVSDRWFEQKGKRMYEQQQGSPNGSRIEKSEPVVDPEFQTVKREWAQFKAERQQEAASKQQAVIQENYNKSLDSLMSKLPKEVPEDKREYILLKAKDLVNSDPQALKRIAQGVYTDVPKYFAEASRRVTADTKTAATAEHEARRGVEIRGSKEITPAAETVNGVANDSKPGEDPIWGNISSAEIKSAMK